MIVAGVQHDIVWEDPRANFARLAPMITRAADHGARLVVCTEMYSTGFSMHTDRTAEPPKGPSAQFLADQAVAQNVWVCGSMPEQPAGIDRPYNQLVLAGPGGELHRYAKIHPFTYAREHERFAPGDARVTVDVDGVAVTLFVCYDLRFADEFWQVAPSTDVYLVPANWPSARRSHWQALLQARAIENQAYVVASNRVGEGGDLTYAGDSRIIDPSGEVLAAAAHTETIVLADVSAACVAETRSRFPFQADRR